MKLAGTVPASATPVESAWSLPGLLCIPLEIVRIARYTQQDGWLANSVWPDYTLDSCRQTHLEHCISSLLSNLQPKVQVPGIAVMISHTIEQSESPSWLSHRYTKMTASTAKEGFKLWIALNECGLSTRMRQRLMSLLRRKVWAIDCVVTRDMKVGLANEDEARNDYLSPPEAAT